MFTVIAVSSVTSGRLPTTLTSATTLESSVVTSTKTPGRVNVAHIVAFIIKQLEMWANAQPDGRPAEHRWRPLFNAAKFG